MGMVATLAFHVFYFFYSSIPFLPCPWSVAASICDFSLGQELHVPCNWSQLHPSDSRDLAPVFYGTRWDCEDDFSPGLKGTESKCHTRWVLPEQRKGVHHCFKTLMSYGIIVHGNRC